MPIDWASTIPVKSKKKKKALRWPGIILVDKIDVVWTDVTCWFKPAKVYIRSRVWSPDGVPT